MPALYPGLHPRPPAPTPAGVERAQRAAEQTEPDWFERLQRRAERAERSTGVRLLRACVALFAIGFVYVVVSLALTMPFALAWLFQ